MKRPMRALAQGVAAVAAAPFVLALAVGATLLTALPFAFVVGSRLQTALAHQPAIDLAAQEIDAEWWMEYRRHARGLEATFTPAILGVAAPLDNLSALADAAPRPWILVLPLALYVGVWSFLWGGILERFHGRAPGIRGFLTAGTRHVTRMIAVSAAAALLVLMLYATLHRLLFGPVFAAFAEAMPDERSVLAVRFVLYGLFAAVLALVSLSADYTRVDVAGSYDRSLRASWQRARQFIQSNWRGVAGLYLATAVLFAALLAAYGLADQRYGGWRVVVAGQLFIVGRIAIRLVGAASQVRFYGMSRVPANPGPPAAT